MPRKINIYHQNARKFTGPAKKVSVIIPNYNYADFITERIDSILRQSYPIYELIILDDCSTDKSCQIIQDKIKAITNTRVKFVPNKKNSGSVFSQWQKGMNLASGDYVWIAEADDSAHPKFLETAMRGFDDNSHHVVLSFTDSARIDENNFLVESHTRPTIHQEKSYIVDGKKEIMRCLAVSNTIFNVSGVVWKKGNYDEIFDKAKEFVVAGDWYIYYRLMEIGDIAYDSHVLNYFRKHSKSVSTTVKDDIEYQEIRRIHEEIASKYPLSNRILAEQRYRLNVMDQKVSPAVRKKRIAWIVPAFGVGSGGHRTIFQNVNALAKNGYECDLYIMDMPSSSGPALKASIAKFYEYPIANVYSGFQPAHQDYDLCFCTGWQTTDAVRLFNCRTAYFVQDFEPWFFPMNGDYLLTENSYRAGYMPITIGRWLAHKMSDEYNAPAQYFDFCADLSIYHPDHKSKKENAICCIYQPEKERRCASIMVPALKIVQQLRPKTKIYLYGTNAPCPDGLKAKSLGMITPQATSALYNKCRVGLCMSASNPSRIPFEMMATGLPVVDLYKENNLYDIPDTAALLAQPTPDAVAAAIINLLDDKKARVEMGRSGIKYMREKPIDHGYAQFIEAVDNIFTKKGSFRSTKKIDQCYSGKCHLATAETTAIMESLTLKRLKEIQSYQPKPRTRLGKVKHFGFRVLRKCYHIARRFI